MNLKSYVWRALGRTAAASLVAGMAVAPYGPSAYADNNKQPGNSPSASGCQLGSDGQNIQHVIYVQFDNTHFSRDRDGVASDLEQMPHLLNFIKGNGTLITDHHTILISHTGGGITSALTGVYPDRNGQAVSNSYGYFDSGVSSGVSFSSTFKYWTDLVDDANSPSRDNRPNMISEDGKTAPAPWPTYTRAGCDYGAVSTANVVLENTRTGPAGDITKVFGNPSPEWTEADNSNKAPVNTAARALAQTDFVGIAIHCAQGGICDKQAKSRPDSLPDEPGGYANFKGLFGAKYVNPAITGGANVVKDLNGKPIQDPFGQPGFPGFDGMPAAVSLGYVAQMQEAGIPVTFAYISDAHDDHGVDGAGPNVAFGPGEAGYKKALADYDAAFDTFFQRLAKAGITKDNSLFVFTADEGDHFAGGNSPNGMWSHHLCNISAGQTCPTNQIGEVNANISQLLTDQFPTHTQPSYQIHFDSAPTFYVKGQPGRTDAAVRQLERDAAVVTAIDPYVSASPKPITQYMADPVGEKLVHMVTADPLRTPTFTLFANPDYFIKTSQTNCAESPAPPVNVTVCVDYHFAWSHGDFTQNIGNTWLGMVGPGVKKNGQDDQTWTDHPDIRPTMLNVLGLQDKYQSDGRVILEALGPNDLKHSEHAHHATLLRLGQAYKQINAPFGDLSAAGLVISTAALKSSQDGAPNGYMELEGKLEQLTSDRNSLAVQMQQMLIAASADDDALNEQQAKGLVDRAQALLESAQKLAAAVK